MQRQQDILSKSFLPLFGILFACKVAPKRKPLARSTDKPNVSKDCTGSSKDFGTLIVKPQL